MTAAARIGVVLSSGGARGVYAHTGFLQALADLGIPITAATGCSAGAVVGGIAASGADLETWSATLARLDPRRFWRPDAWPRLLWRLIVRRGRATPASPAPRLPSSFAAVSLRCKLSSSAAIHSMCWL